MKLFGLTGGIGMGKSTAAKMLQARGIPVLDTDIVARELVEPGQPALEEITATFGPEMLAADGCLRRDEMARKVFGDPAALKKLEAILHPRVREVWLKQIETWRAENHARAVVVIPLLFETEAQEHFDATICVACGESSQQKRLLARGWNEKQIQQRCAAQWPVSKKMEASNYVVWTEGELEVSGEQLDRIMSKPD
jgi:dephospho-CoA kinase